MEPILADPFVRPDVRRFLDYLNALPGPRNYEVGAVEARNMMRTARDVSDAPVGEVAFVRDAVAPGPAGDIPLRVYDARADRGPGPVVLFLHGGGFVFGDIFTHEPFCAEIARLLDLPVVSVDYRLAPEAPWPAAPEDCIAAARFVAANPATLGRDVTGLIPAGDSAGGNLTIIVSLALRDDPANAPVIAQWPIYPAADPTKGYPSFSDFGEGYLLSRASMKWFDDCYRPDGKDWRYAPLLKSQKGMPPTLVVTAGLDPIRDQGRAYAAACIEAGVSTVFREAEGNIHGFINLRRAIPSSQADIEGCTTVLKHMIAEHLPTHRPG
ncbi:alpha/beta hydrolase [Allosphingosinicella indica]|uniref:Acetyl esterase n=1 Tax=Allosphingosinicella indica TaxID=941907 RepID=A0A1X7GLG3_9SPHN|nr:alpha/beta hydrolase [Allosphingosinicella indica]SMF71427.1 acetyl esterase [Allosphingosinicella indica]